MTTTVPATIVQPRSGTAIETMQRNLAIYSPGKRLIKQLANQLAPKKRALISLEKQTLSDPMVKAIAANSNYVARQLADHYHYPSDKVTVIPNAATLPKMSDDERATWRTQVRHGYQIADDSVVFVFAAMNPLLKGLGPLLVAFERLVAADMSVTLVLAGKFQKQYVDQADEDGIREHVRFIGPTNEMVKLYAASDVLVHPTFYDPSSKVVIEALMMGIPAISTSYNGASDMIAPEDAQPRGMVITNPADTNALADAMIQMVDPANRKTFSDATTGLAESLSMKVHVDRLVELFNQVVEKH
jgi:UDP-glucose:(heptosyl)LPS alpha-1,3-glucosyltransferase